MQARNMAFRWPKGTSGRTPLARCYYQARELARKAAPDSVQVLIDLQNDPECDPRVRSVCAMAVLDRAGVRPIDFDPAEELKNARKPAFNPADFSMDERAQIEATLRLIVDRKKEKARALADT
jgi:hypothetical protein